MILMDDQAGKNDFKTILCKPKTISRYTIERLGHKHTTNIGESL